MTERTIHTQAAYTSIEGWLRGCVGFTIDENAINTILINRELAHGTNVLDVPKRTRELCKADLCMWCASSPSVKGSVEDQHGEWKHKEGGVEISAFDKRDLRATAYGIYKKYGENSKVSSMKMCSTGMKLW